MPRTNDGHGRLPSGDEASEAVSTGWPERLGSVTLTLWLSALRASHLSDFETPANLAQAANKPCLPPPQLPIFQSIGERSFR